MPAFARWTAPPGRVRPRQARARSKAGGAGPSAARIVVGAQVDPQLVGRDLQHPGVGGGVGGQCRGEHPAGSPVQEGAGLLDDRRHRKTTSARSVDAGAGGSRLTTKGVASGRTTRPRGRADRPARRRRSAGGAEPAVGRGGQDAGGVEALAGRQGVHIPRSGGLPARCRRRPASRRRTGWAGSRLQCGAFPGDAGSGDPGAGGVGGTATAENAPGLVASRSPVRMIDPGGARRAARPAPRPHAAGRGRHQVCRQFGQAAGGERCDRDDAQPRLRTALRSRRNTIGDSSSGSSPTSTNGRGPRSGTTRSWAGPATRDRQEAGLLVAVAGPEVDIVGVQHESCEPAVGAGVLHGAPPTRTPARPAAPAAERDADRLRPRRRPQHPSSRSSGVVIRSPWVAWVKAQRPLSQFHSSLTSGSSPAAAQHFPAPVVGALRAPDAQCSQTLGEDTRSKGPGRNR